MQVNRLEEDWVPKQDTRDAAVVEAEARKYEAQKRAEVLEMVGDLPSADAAPPPNMIFVCKLNPVTTDEVSPSLLTLNLDSREWILRVCSGGLGSILSLLSLDYMFWWALIHSSLKGKRSHCRPYLLMPAAYQTPMAWIHFCSFRSHALFV